MPSSAELMVRRKALVSAARLVTLHKLHLLTEILQLRRHYDKFVTCFTFDKVQNVPQLL
jgi:hypothetical protein